MPRDAPRHTLKPSVPNSLPAGTTLRSGNRVLLSSRDLLSKPSSSLELLKAEYINPSSLVGEKILN
ncbi:hypothetical protein PGTUg99_027000 [Puccinia graminis f. sp. tritici]|uniref:Uncharacterized protein n=1 Tax=Puccinia graminis f. sp. tritici TaxID=56615 RepID=A0A5B0R9G6_PUCGR|nr:hypothetical protein PGTUg99_027000 [Puccinia graminis f. sp. tritici]